MNDWKRVEGGRRRVTLVRPCLSFLVWEGLLKLWCKRSGGRKRGGDILPSCAERAWFLRHVTRHTQRSAKTGSRIASTHTSLLCHFFLLMNHITWWMTPHERVMEKKRMHCSAHSNLYVRLFSLFLSWYLSLQIHDKNHVGDYKRDKILVILLCHVLVLLTFFIYISIWKKKTSEQN